MEVFVRAHPFAVLALSHGVVASVALVALSEGRPLQLLRRLLFRSALALVPAALVEAKQKELRADIEKSVIGHSLEGEAQFTALPEKGLPKAEVLALLDHYADKDLAKRSSCRISGAIYHGGDALTEVMGEAFRRFALSNPLHPDVFPCVRKMEAEVVAMVLRLFHGEAADARAPPGGGACGCMTSGGTESILMAVKTYRDMARARRGITEPEIVVPITAHAAFDKACHYFGVKLVHVPVDPGSFRAVPAAMARAITSNTIGLVCSAPSYPQGVVDPVAELAALARTRGLPLHVDCCLGSFCVAFAERAGFPVSRAFDFLVDGVTSISVDTHKYGFAPKGSSVILYASRELRHAQYFVAPDWSGGIYASPAVAGSRPGALIAACWATLMTVGAEGYTDATRAILVAARTIADGVHGVPHLRLFGEPDLSVISFGAVDAAALNIYHVGDAMGRRGWNLNSLQNPACLHICVTYANQVSAARFAEDLHASVDEVRSAPPGSLKGGSAAMYGLAASIPDKSVVSQVAFGFLDALYACPPAT